MAMKYDKFSDFDEFNNAPAYDKRDAAEQINQEGQKTWLVTTSGVEYDHYFRCDANAELLRSFCHEKGIPMTRTNLESAFQVLKQDGALSRVEATPKEPPTVFVRPHVTDGFVEIVEDHSGAHSNEPGIEALAQIAGDVTRPDAERKNAEQRMKILATRERIANRNEHDKNFERNQRRNQRVVI